MSITASGLQSWGFEYVPILKKRTSGADNPTLRGRASGPKDSYYLVHVTSVGAAREIIRAEQIEMRYCEAFGRNLVYFFALRPAYKLKGSEEKRSIIDFFPSVFLVSTEHMPSPFHVYPFDTGGALQGAFDDGASDHVFLADYELETNFQAASDHISWAFETRENYYDGKLRPRFSEQFPSWDVGPLTFEKIAGLASIGRNRPDRRASAIELAFETHVRLDRIRLIILPKQFMEHPAGDNTEMIESLKAARVEWETYEWQSNRTAADFHGEINGIVREHLKNWGSL